MLRQGFWRWMGGYHAHTGNAMRLDALALGGGPLMSRSVVFWGMMYGGIGPVRHDQYQAGDMARYSST